VHHRVKQSAGCLLANIEARRNKQSTIEDFIEKAEGRIEVFALIHQSLSDRKTVK
jgi:two-component sensor histidine kinase